MAPSLGTALQYVFIAVLGYVLVGSPLTRILSGGPSGKRGRTRDNDWAPEVPLSPEKFESLVIPDPGLECPEHRYSVHLFSREPLVVYIENFVTDEEMEHLINISLPLFQPSTIFNANQPSIDPNVRLSKKAQPPRTHHVRCIEARARSFQGFRPYTFVEKLWTQLYDAGGHYTHHYDWASASPSAGRISSFMVYLDANCTGGGTNFPRLERPRESEWCKWIECPAEAGREQGGIGGAGDDADENRDDEKQVMDGVTWKPIRGNAVYWENFDMDGRGYEESWHAGMPVTSGTKIGLNIWSWYQKGYRPPPPPPEETDTRQGS